MDGTTVASFYIAAGGLAALAAVSELVSRFRDEPLLVLRGLPAHLYLALNAGLALLVLWLLRLASHPDDNVAALEQVLLAGFGARVLVRTKMVGFRTSSGGKAEEIGPGAVVEQLLGAISRRADRNRAAERLAAVSAQLDGLGLEVALQFIAEMAGAMQDLTEDEKQQITGNVQNIVSRSDIDERTRVHLLGYLIVNFAGDDFLRKVTAPYRNARGAAGPPGEPVRT